MARLADRGRPPGILGGVSPIHIHAQEGDLAPYVLLPGDPKRATRIAEGFLEEPRLYNDHRGLVGYTGRYRGVPVSVQTTGMGTPSAAIVVEELVRLGARVLIRVGTAGALSRAVRPGELVVATGAVPADGTTRQYLGGRPYAPVPSHRVLRALVDAAEESGTRVHPGLIVTEDGFYATTPEEADLWAGYGALAIEMESAAIFLLAKMRGVEAGTVLAVSNRVGDPELVSDEVMTRAVDRMIAVALAAILRLEEAK